MFKFVAKSKYHLNWNAFYVRIPEIIIIKE